MGVRHIVSKAAFINENYGLARVAMRLNPRQEATPFVVVRLGMDERFVGKTIHWIVF